MMIERREKQKLIYFKLDLLSIFFFFFNKNYSNNYFHPLDIHFFSLFKKNSSIGLRELFYNQ
jgi:hypothetical protein